MGEFIYPTVHNFNLTCLVAGKSQWKTICGSLAQHLLSNFGFFCLLQSRSIDAGSPR